MEVDMKLIVAVLCFLSLVASVLAKDQVWYCSPKTNVFTNKDDGWKVHEKIGSQESIKFKLTKFF